MLKVNHGYYIVVNHGYYIVVHQPIQISVLQLNRHQGGMKQTQTQQYQLHLNGNKKEFCASTKHHRAKGSTVKPTRSHPSEGENTL